MLLLLLLREEVGRHCCCELGRDRELFQFVSQRGPVYFVELALRRVNVLAELQCLQLTALVDYLLQTVALELSTLENKQILFFNFQFNAKSSTFSSFLVCLYSKNLRNVLDLCSIKFSKTRVRVRIRARARVRKYKLKKNFQKSFLQYKVLVLRFF